MDDFRREAVELHRNMSLQVQDETCLEMIQKALQDATAFVTGQRDAARLHRAQAEKERDAANLQNRVLETHLRDLIEAVDPDHHLTKVDGTRLEGHAGCEVCAIIERGSKKRNQEG